LKERLREFARVKKAEYEQRVKKYSKEKAMPCPEFLIATHKELPMIWRMSSDCDSAFFRKEWYKNYKSRLELIGSEQLFPRVLFETFKEVYRDSR
jgi:hypothetical protein